MLVDVERRGIHPRRPTQPPPRPAQDLAEARDQVQAACDPFPGDVDAEAPVGIEQGASFQDGERADVLRPPLLLGPDQHEVGGLYAIDPNVSALSRCASMPGRGRVCLQLTIGAHVESLRSRTISSGHRGRECRTAQRRRVRRRCEAHARSDGSHSRRARRPLHAGEGAENELLRLQVGPTRLAEPRGPRGGRRDAEDQDAAAEFLSHKRIAVTGVSRTPKGHGANVVYQRLRQHGYEVYAVNPNADEVEGDPCYHDLESIPGGVEGVVIGTRSEVAEDTMREAVRPRDRAGVDAPRARSRKRVRRRDRVRPTARRDGDRRRVPADVPSDGGRGPQGDAVHVHHDRQGPEDGLTPAPNTDSGRPKRDQGTDRFDEEILGRQRCVPPRRLQL